MVIIYRYYHLFNVFNYFSDDAILASYLVRVNVLYFQEV